MPLFLQRPELLAGFHRGDERVLEEVYWAYYERVAGVALLMRSGSRVRGAGDTEVEDLVHETFKRAFTDKSRRNYDGKRPYGPYLATIARNLLVDEARRRGRELPTAELPEDLPEEVTEVLEWAEPDTVRAVETYLSQLPKELQAIHEQRYVKGSSQEAAATALGLSREQIRTLEQRLRDGLREHLQKISSQAGAPSVGTVGATK